MKRLSKILSIWLAGIVLLIMAPFLFQSVQSATANAASKSVLEKRVDNLVQANAALQVRVEELERKIRLLESSMTPVQLPVSLKAPPASSETPNENEVHPGASSNIPLPPEMSILKLSPPGAPSTDGSPPYGFDEVGVPGSSDAPSLFEDDPGFVDAPSGSTGNMSSLPEAPSAAPEVGISVEAATLFESALGQYHKGELEMAIEAFQLYLTKYPDSSYEPYATFYLGECFYQKHRYQNGMEQYRRLLMKYPESDAAPEALYKMGMCFYNLSDNKSAKQAFNRVIENYPFSEAARSAEAQLKKM